MSGDFPKQTLLPVSVGGCVYVGVETVGAGTVAKVARSVGNFVVVTVVVGAKAFTIASMSNEDVGKSVGASHLSACTTALDDITLTSSCAGDVVVGAFDDGFAMELKSDSRVSSLEVAGIDSPCRFPLPVVGVERVGVLNERVFDVLVENLP